MITDQFLWCEKYRPKKVADVVLPERLKTIFQSYVDQKNIPTLLLTGSSGVGKTTIAKAMLDELGCDSIMINGSLEGRKIDTLRDVVVPYASTVSFVEGRKYVIVDEADYMNPESVQPALRNFIEEFSDNCGFIFTCNFKYKILPAIHSRCSIVDFSFTKEEQQKMVVEFFKRATAILKTEGIEYDKNAVGLVVKKYQPDWRRILNELQQYAASGKIDTGILANLKEMSLDEICKILKEKDFNAMRKWVTENSDADPTELFTAFFKHASKYLKKTSIPPLVLLLSKYQYQSAFAANQEINTAAFFVEVMMEAEFD